MEKIIYLKAPVGTQIILAFIGILFVFSGVYTFFLPTEQIQNPAYSIVYFLLGLLIILYTFKDNFFGNGKFIKFTDKFIEIKRWSVTRLIKINIEEIEEIKFIASRVSIKYADTQELINLDWISSQSRKELAVVLKELAQNKDFPYEVINIFDKFKDKELK